MSGDPAAVPEGHVAADAAQRQGAPRKRDAAATRMALLVAAQLRFSQDGYEHTTVRDVAADVGVNQALVFRYFGSKDGLFEEAAEIANPMAIMTETPLEQVPDAMLRLILDKPDEFEGPHPLLALLRSTGHDEARERLRTHLARDFTDQFAARLAAPDSEVRAELLAAWMLGIGVLRAVIGTPALSSATFDEISGPFRDGVHALLGLSGQQDTQRDG